MKKYATIGLFTLVVLGLGFLLGTGAIGDLMRGGEASIGGGADSAEAEATDRALANQYAETIGQSLGEGNQPINYATAVRCRALAQFAKGRTYFEGFDRAQLDAIIANASAIAVNTAPPDAVVELDVARVESQLLSSGRTTVVSGINSAADKDEMDRAVQEDDAPKWVELRNLCGPLAS